MRIGKKLRKEYDVSAFIVNEWVRDTFHVSICKRPSKHKEEVHFYFGLLSSTWMYSLLFLFERTTCSLRSTICLWFLRLFLHPRCIWFSWDVMCMWNHSSTSFFVHQCFSWVSFFIRLLEITYMKSICDTSRNSFDGGFLTLFFFNKAYNRLLFGCSPNCSQA